jgi:hypothetical protein
VIFGRNWKVKATSPKPGFAITVHDAIPEKLCPSGRNLLGMTQLRSVFAVSEVKNA